MVIRITWGKLRAGAWNEFERTYRANVITKGKTLKGLRGRWLGSLIGSRQRVLIESDRGGHTDNFAPIAVDRAERGQIFNVRITGRDGDHLVGFAA